MKESNAFTGASCMLAMKHIVRYGPLTLYHCVRMLYLEWLPNHYRYGDACFASVKLLNTGMQLYWLEYRNG